MVFSLNESLIYSTVKITKIIDGNVVESGTAFFWNASSDDNILSLCLVTNKHVVDGAHFLMIKVHLADFEGDFAPNGMAYDHIFKVNDAGVVDHPDPNVDLCALGIGGLIVGLEKAGYRLFYSMLSSVNIPNSQQFRNFDAIEDVLMIGCPSGLIDEVNNRPIARRGITATQIGVNYNGSDEFLIDMACFPGSSGSPVFINQSSYLDKNSGAFVVGMSRFFLVGILYAGPIFDNHGVVNYSNQFSFNVSSMMHLGNVISSKKLLDINRIVQSRAVMFDPR